MTKDKRPKQKCKHCGAKVPGVNVGFAAGPCVTVGKRAKRLPGFHYVLLFQFKCTAPGRHGNGNRERKWESIERYTNWRTLRTKRFGGAV